MVWPEQRGLATETSFCSWTVLGRPILINTHHAINCSHHTDEGETVSSKDAGRDATQDV